MAENLRNYVNTYLWGFTSEQLAIFLYIIMGASGLVMIGTGRLAARWGKRRLAIAGCAMAGVLFPGMIALRLAGILPGGGEPILLRILSFSVFFEYSGIIVAMTMVGAMIADITDEHELRTGSRQEGLLYSASTFLIKTSSGLGVLVAGFVITISGFPEGADPAAVDPRTVWNLGAFAGLLNLLLWASAVLLFRSYRLSRERHTEILGELEVKRSQRAAERLAPR
jgi:Na+/melibiose symporter-like transporter